VFEEAAGREVAMDQHHRDTVLRTGLEVVDAQALSVDGVGANSRQQVHAVLLVGVMKWQS